MVDDVQRSEFSKSFPAVPVKPELMQNIKVAHATFLSVQGLVLPQIFRDIQAREELQAVYVVVLWSKDRVIGGVVVVRRTPREVSPSYVRLLASFGTLSSSYIVRSHLFYQDH